jgi:AcrR family transcriptional regulator
MMRRPDLPDNSVSIGTASSEKALIYKSATIFERRRRILREARAMISGSGYENFSIRELARRAEVAQKTLYNAFGSRENIIITAIYQYSNDFAEHTQYLHPEHTLEGRLERAIKVHSRNLQLRPYATAVMAIYNTTSSDTSIRQAIRKLSNDALRPFADHLAARRQLATDVTPDGYSERVTSFMYCTLSSWCLGEIPDNAMVESMAETLAMVTLASTKGAVKKEAGDWLQHIRTRSSEWERLRAQSAVPPPSQRATARLSRNG